MFDNRFSFSHSKLVRRDERGTNNWNIYEKVLDTMTTRESDKGMQCKKGLSYISRMFCIAHDMNNTLEFRRGKEDPDQFES